MSRTINELNTTATIVDADKLVLWQEQSGSTRAITAADAAAYFSIAGGPYQPLDELLTAIAGQGPNTANGDFIQLTGQDTVRVRKLTVATYAALTVIPASFRFDDMLVYVASRATDGDGGEGWWRFDAASNATANGGTILAPDAGTGRWIRQYTGALQAVFFGVVADGTTDATTALQAAVTAAGSGVLILPVGTIIHTTITLGTSGLTIRGQGKDKTILKLKASTNNNSIFATGKNWLTFEDLTIDQNVAGGNTGEGSHGGIRLEGNPNDIVIKSVRVTGARGTFSAAPVGAGYSSIGGSRCLLMDCEFDDCYDGASFVGTTEVTSIRSYVHGNQRNGLLPAANAHNFRQFDTVADGNATTYAGAGVLVLDSLHAQSFGGTYINATLGHGLQHNGADYAETHGGTYSDNGISGLDFFDSLYGQVHGGIAKDNAVRGLEIDSASNGAVVYGFAGSGNTDVDVSIFRSASVALRDIQGDVRVWDASVLNSTGHTIAAAGSGYTDGTHSATLVGGTFGTAGVLNVTISGGALTAINSVTTVGDYWTLPANPVSLSGIPGGGAGATVNVDWSADGSNTCADLEAHGGLSGATLLMVSGASSDARISNIRGTVTDAGGNISSAVACDAFSVPIKSASLQNSWVVATRAVYYKDADGIVHIEGRIQSGTVGANTLIFTLAAGFRPANTEYFLVPVSGSTGVLYIGTDGTVRDLGGSLNATWSSLNGISFRAV